MSFDEIVPFLPTLGIWAALTLSTFVLTPWAVLECLIKEAPVGNTKMTWVVAIIFLPVFGPLAYLVVRRPQRKDELGR